MSTYSLNSFQAQVILVGQFNPAIVSPDWLEAKALITPEDAELCRNSIEAVGRSRVMKYACKWFKLTALDHQFSLITNDGATPRIRDLAAAILGLLPETPIKAFGINFDAHYKIQDVHSYHKIGDAFVPKAAFLAAIPELDGKSTNAGMLNLSIALDTNTREMVSSDKVTRRQKRINIEPSNPLRNGIYMLYNNHYVIDEMDSKDRYSPALAAQLTINSAWEDSLEEARTVFEKLLDSALEGER